MSAIERIQTQIIQEFNAIGDSFDQYSYLIELACQLPALPDSEKTEEHLIKGCHSLVYLLIHVEDGRLYVRADSNTLILKGVLFLLIQMFSGQPVGEIAKARVRFLSETALMETFESDRQKGIGYIIQKIQTTAAAYAKPEG